MAPATTAPTTIATSDDDGVTEAFPMLTPTTTATVKRLTTTASDFQPAGNDDRSSVTGRRTRGASIKSALLNSNPPLGMWHATGEVGSKIPTLPEIKNGAFSDAGWSHEGQMEHRGTNPHEIHRRRLARTSTSSTRTRLSSITAGTAAVTPNVVDEDEELKFFPRRGVVTQPSLVIEDTTVRRGGDGGGDGQDDLAGIENGKATVQATDLANRADSVDAATATALATAASPTADAAKELASAHINGEVVGNNSISPDETGTYPNGYRFPKKHTWSQSTAIGLKAFWKFFLTPFGFLVTFYGLNVVGWGAMIFFLLLEAAPAMCHPSCGSEKSERKIWIEVDSQVLNGLFCVTAFGLAPWRFRDFYYLLRWRVWHNYDAHRRLAGLYRGWYRLPGSDKLPDDIGPPPVYDKKHPATPESPPVFSDEEIKHLEANPAIPLPVTSMPEPPLTGVRAPPSRSWTLDAVICLYIANTFLQVVLCGFMWGFNRHNRPSWGTGLFISLGCLTGIFAGIVIFIEGSRVKKIEGIPVQEYDVVESVEDYRERKAKEDHKLEKKEQRERRHEERHEHRHERRVLRSAKVKGHEWFTRH